MKNRKICVLLAVLFCLVCSSTLKAQKASIGKVDLYTAILLHPSMMNFSGEMKAFKIERKEKDAEKIKKENEEKAKLKVELEKKIKILKEEIDKEDERYSLVMGDLNYSYVQNQEETATGTVELNKILYKRKSEEAVVYHMARLKGIYTECVEYQKKLDSLNEVQPDYTNQEETRQKFIEIINDIKKHSKSEASKKGISIVLNSSYRNLMPRNLNYNENINFSDNFSFGSIFTDPYPVESFKDVEAVKGYYLNVESKTEDWLKNGVALLGITSDIVVAEDILVGGIDLTSDVLNSIYKEHKIDANLTKAILKCIKTK